MHLFFSMVQISSYLKIRNRFQRPASSGTSHVYLNPSQECASGLKLPAASCGECARCRGSGPLTEIVTPFRIPDKHGTWGTAPRAGLSSRHDAQDAGPGLACPAIALATGGARLLCSSNAMHFPLQQRGDIYRNDGILFTVI